jgi:hypothetical protein
VSRLHEVVVGIVRTRPMIAALVRRPVALTSSGCRVQKILPGSSLAEQESSTAEVRTSARAGRRARRRVAKARPQSRYVSCAGPGVRAGIAGGVWEVHLVGAHGMSRIVPGLMLINVRARAAATWLGVAVTVALPIIYLPMLFVAVGTSEQVEAVNSLTRRIGVPGSSWQ